MSLVEYPELLSPENRDWLQKKYPQDAIERADSFYKQGMHSAGAYTHSQGAFVCLRVGACVCGCVGACVCVRARARVDCLCLCMCL